MLSHRSIVVSVAVVTLSATTAFGMHMLYQNRIKADLKPAPAEDVSLPAPGDVPVVKDAKPPETAKQPAKPKPPREVASRRYPAHYGANIKTYGMNKAAAPYSRENLIKQLDWAKELGAVDVRSNAEVNLADTDDFVNLAIEKGLNPMLVIEPFLNDFFNQATYSQGYNYAIGIARRYRGKVKYYQLGNEASGVAIKKGFSGNKTTDYDDDKYAAMREWLRGLSEGVRYADPDAYRMISSNWLGVGVIDRLVADDVQFELIGWNWYSDMGTDLIKTVDGKKFSIPEYLKKYQKEFWVVELNRQGGTLDGNEQAQADYLKTFIENASSHNNLGGVFVFPLTDLCPDLDTSVGRMGIIRLLRQDDGSCIEDGKKPAFDIIKDLFSQFKG